MMTLPPESTFRCMYLSSCPDPICNVEVQAPKLVSLMMYASRPPVLELPSKSPEVSPAK